MTKLKKGGQVASLASYQKLDTISITSEEPMVIMLWLNDSSISYLDVEEAVQLRNELNEAISAATGIL